MNVNGITEVANAYGAYTSSTPKKAEEAKEEKSKEEKVDAFAGDGVVYEKSSEADKASKKTTYTKNTDLIAKLKAENEARTQQLQDIVTKLMTQQGKTYDAAKGLKSFYESLEVDAETKAQAQKDIAEDGYYGVEQTSSRIFDFAMALTGGDPDKVDSMVNAFKKGYKQAEKTWGGELPEICKNTYDAVLKKFDDYKNGVSAAEE